MSRVLQQSVTFAVPAARLFNTYMDAKQHAAATGAPVVIGRKAGSRFSAFGGELAGRTLTVVPGRMVVQTWRARSWPKADGDSILILTFTDTPRGGRIDLVHANVPAHDYAGVKTGWTKFYWQPWRAHLRKSIRA